MALFKDLKKNKESGGESRTSGKSEVVEFAVNAPKAHEVHLAGSFNDWNTGSLPLRKDKDGMWKIKINLPKGRHEYKYFIDGDWAQNMPCTTVVPNTFGTGNCVVAVT